MDIFVTIKMVKSYYEECYSETIKYRLKYRKWQPYISVFYLLLFVFFFAISSGQKSYQIFMIGSLLTGLWIWYDLIQHKRKWLNARLEREKEGQLVKLHFTADGIESEGPFSKGIIKWDGFLAVEETAKGVFLVIEKGMNVYLSNSDWATPEDKKIVLEKFESIPHIEVKYFNK